MVNADEKIYSFHINNELIPVVDQIKYLGFIITNTGSWDLHINYCVNKVFGISKKWYDILKSRNLPFDLKLRIADSIILSHLRYGEEIYTLNNVQIKNYNRQKIEY